MNPFTFAYKLGSAKALERFTSQMGSDSDNPTAEPPMKMAGRRAVDRILKETAEKKEKIIRPRTISRTPVKGNPGLNRLRARLKKHK
jgi:hypothetical protein